MNTTQTAASAESIDAVEVLECLDWQGMRAAQATSISIRTATLDFLPNGPHQVAGMANLGAELLQEIYAYRPQFLFKSSPAEIVGALIEEMALSDAARDVLTERRRQVTAKGWDHDHDDAQRNDEIAAFAAVYAMPENVRCWPAKEIGRGRTLAEALTPIFWLPKFGDRRRDLVKAAALLVAEIERIDRAAIAASEMEAS